MTIFAVKRASGKAYRVTYNKVNVGTFRTLALARKAEAEHIARLQEQAAEAAPLTIAAWREEWLQDYRDRPDTRRHYEERTRAFVKAHGAELLADFTPRQAKRWAVEHRSTVSVVKTMFNAAYKDDVIERFPWKNVETPKYVREIEPGWLSLDEVNQLAALGRRVRDDAYAPMISAMVTVAAWTAIRPGELFAIRERDINRDRHELRIRQAVNSKTKGLKMPKSGYARTVVIPQAAIDAIDASRDAYAFAMAGKPEPEDPTLFVTVTGRRLSVASWTASYWGPLRVLFGRPSMEWYELRHFGATVLLNAGASYEDVAHQLGHADVDLVRRVYGHPEAVRIRTRIHAAMLRAQAETVKTGTGDAAIIAMPRRD